MPSHRLIIMLFAALLLLGLAQPGQAAAEPSCRALMQLREDGSVEVSGEFSGLAVEQLELYTGTKDAGILKLAVMDGRSAFQYVSSHHLRSEAGKLFLASPDFYVPGADTTLTLEVRYPPSLKLAVALPEPGSSGLGRARWEIRAAHNLVQVQFELRESAVAEQGAPGDPTENEAQANPSEEAREALARELSIPPGGKLFDPVELATLALGEEARSGIEIVEELAFAIKLAKLEGETDPGFLRALDKLLAKLYRYLEQNGVLVPE